MKKSFLLLSFLCAAAFIYAQDGTLDNSFGFNGRVVTDVTGNNDHAKDILIQNDGKIIVAGYAVVNQYPIYSQLVRYNTDGSVDDTFGTDGRVKYRYFDTTRAFEVNNAIQAMALQSNGKIVTCGYIYNSLTQGNDIIVLRFNTNGALDSTFNGKGQLIMSFNPAVFANNNVKAITIQPDGKIVIVGGFSSLPIKFNRMALARLNTNGSLDATFNETGRVVMDIDASKDDYAVGTTIVKDNKIFVYARLLTTNSTTGIVTTDMVLLRFNTNGSLDMSFGTNGKTIINGDYAAHKVMNDGKIVVSTVVENLSDFSFVTTRYTTNGFIDSTFGTNGKVATIGRNITFAIKDVVIQKDKKIVVCGETSGVLASTFIMARYNESGTLDNSFGTNGLSTTTFNLVVEHYTKMAVQADGKLVACGQSLNNRKLYVNVIRFKNTIVSTQELKNTPLSIFPNPTNNVLNIDIKEAINSDFHIKITDRIGRLVFQKRYDKTSSNFISVNTSDLTSGMYVVTLVANNQSISRVVFKE